MYRKVKALIISLCALSGFIVSILLLPGTSLIVAPKQFEGQAKFRLASWSYGDGYGQGIDGFFIYENSTGSWNIVDGYVSNTDPGVFNWTAGVAVKLDCWTGFNSTLTGAATTAEGKNYQRHNVTVKNFEGTTVFSKQNFTYYSVDIEYTPMWLYEYYVVLNFLPLAGEYYTVTVTYDVFY